MRLNLCKHSYIRVCPVCDPDIWDETSPEFRISKEIFESDRQGGIEFMKRMAERENERQKLIEREDELQRLQDERR